MQKPNTIVHGHIQVAHPVGGCFVHGINVAPALKFSSLLVPDDVKNEVHTVDGWEFWAVHFGRIMSIQDILLAPAPTREAVFADVSDLIAIVRRIASWIGNAPLIALDPMLRAQSLAAYAQVQFDHIVLGLAGIPVSKQEGVIWGADCLFLYIAPA